MSDMKHKGYSGSINPSMEDRCLHGRILFIDDIITYEGRTVDEIEASFIQAVDEYIEYCAQTGRSANKPYSGGFNIRVGQERHRAVAHAARKNNTSLNDFVCKAIDRSLALDEVIKHEITVNHVVSSESSRNVEIDYTTKDSSWQAKQKTKLTVVR